MANNIIKLLRLEHWTKNLFVFLPVFFGGQLLNASALLPCVVAFIAFLLADEDFIDIQTNCGLKAFLTFLVSPVLFCRYCGLKKMKYGEKWEVSRKNILEWT
ncbi:MAG: hypothetical protein FWC23_00195 [Chitinispirillia bacterium]|nr:hypothetical protein [Chitinispirillia bacterium]MCL2267595.1 hypothetical protein [Chitinispirillia bacterium]